MKGFKKMGELLSDQVSHGTRMGFKHGGHVAQPNTSPQFHQKTVKQDSMDHGVQPAGEGTTEQDKEAGGTAKLKPKYRRGGHHRMTRKAYAKKNGSMKGYKKYAEGGYADPGPLPSGVKKKGGSMKKGKYMKGGLAAAKEGMPKNVKMKGGRMRKGGYNSTPMVGK